eukprot:scaffold641212_cov53-Prasinocladus_malaysianus.AAC.2
MANVSARFWVTAEPMDGEELHTVHVTKFLKGHYAFSALRNLSIKVPEGSLAVVKGKLGRKKEENTWDLTGSVEILSTTEMAKKQAKSSLE